MIGVDELRWGLFPAVPVPTGPDGRPHRDGQRRLVEHLAAGPIAGVAAWAHTGRGTRLGPADRASVLADWRRGLRPGQVLIAAAGAGPEARAAGAVLDQARGMARQAADLGADALLVHPPTALRDAPAGQLDELVLDYHAAVAEAGLPLLLFYLYPEAGGVAYGPGLLARLLARPEVLGIKVATLDSVMTFQEIAANVRATAPGKLIVSGEDRFLGYSFLCGAEAALVGLGSAGTSLQAGLIRSYRDGDAARFLALSRAVDEFGRRTFRPPMEGYIRRMLACLVALDVLPAESARDPWGPTLDPAELEELGRWARAELGPIGTAPA